MAADDRRLSGASVTAQGLSPAGTAWGCHRCGALVPNGCTHHCPTGALPFAGLPYDRQPWAGDPALAPRHDRFCGRCGEHAARDARYCVRCGYAV